ncbi:MAG: hypothetical protein JNN30_04785 [Rhodanobacteraceae bacterium]|nr:hypothetical protein [Rhodanobacteraceae bacterium]
MNTKEVKAKIHDHADHIESGVAAAAASLGNGAEAIGEKAQQINDALHEFGTRLFDSTKALTDEAVKQARQRPLVVFGAAFIAGLIVARALHR